MGSKQLCPRYLGLKLLKKESLDLGNKFTDLYNKITKEIPESFMSYAGFNPSLAIKLMVNDLKNLHETISSMHNDFETVNNLRLKANETIELLIKEKKRLEEEVVAYKNLALEKNLCDWCVHDGGTTACCGCDNYKNFTKKE